MVIYVSEVLQEVFGSSLGSSILDLFISYIGLLSILLLLNYLCMYYLLGLCSKCGLICDMASCVQSYMIIIIENGILHHM